MNKDNAPLYLPLVQALIDGKLQRNDGTAIYPEWNDARSLSEAVGIGNYRVKPLDFAPIPEGATRHNPDNLTPEQVGDGWRLLVTDEICEDPPAYKACHCWLENGAWSTGEPYYGNSSSCTYRVPLSTPYPDGSRVVDGKLVKPWKLTREIPGFRPLRDGEEWHRTDWTEEMLPEGWRPLLKGERPTSSVPHDEYRSGWDLLGNRFDPQYTFSNEAPDNNTGFWRTRRPLPEPQPEPAKEKFYAVYEDLQPDAEPAKVPLGPGDWMKDGPWWIRQDKHDTEPRMVIGLNGTGVLFHNVCSTEHFIFDSLMDMERSNDGINWTPCWKEGAPS